MINFRYHLVSLVAVFLALAIGIIAGSTVIKESILDQTQQNLDQAEKNLKDLEDTNTKLRGELDQLKSRDESLDRLGAADFLQHRLDGVSVLVVKVDGIDGNSATMVQQALTAAGADIAAVVTFTDRLTLGTAGDVAALRQVLGTPTPDAVSLRAELAARLGTLVTSVSDSRPATVAAPSTTTAIGGGLGTPGVGIDPAPTSLVSASRQASDALRTFLAKLDDAGFAKVSGDSPAGVLDLGGMRLVVLSGAGAKLDNGLFIYPFLGRLVGAAEPAALAVEATTDGSEVSRGSFVGPIRNDGTLRDHVATVDDVEWFVGRAAAVMALQQLVAGAVGHYGVGDGASQLLPTATA